MKRIISLPCLLLLTLGSGLGLATDIASALPGGTWDRNLRITATVARARDSGFVQVYRPAGWRPGQAVPILIALHGYRGKRTDWERNTRIAELADRLHCLVALPDMGKSWYNTIGRRSGDLIPGLDWLMLGVTSYLFKRYPASPTRVAIIGVSNGGRGAAMAALAYPDQVALCGSFSGDLDITQEPAAPGLAALYGPWTENRDLWRQENAADLVGKKPLADLRRVRWFVTHGKADAVVRMSQSRRFVQALRARGLSPEYREVAAAGHTWNFWNAELRHLEPALAATFRKLNQSR